MQYAEISGGTLSGNGLFETLILKDGFELDTASFTGAIQSLTAEVGSQIRFLVDSVAADFDFFSKLNVLSAFDAANAMFIVDFDASIAQEDWTAFDLKRLFNFGSESLYDSLDWSKFEIHGLSDWAFDGSFVRQMVNGEMAQFQEPTVAPTPEPATLFVVLAGAAGLPLLRRKVRSRTL